MKIFSNTFISDNELALNLWVSDTLMSRKTLTSVFSQDRYARTVVAYMG
jgi:hypothetical protein